MGVIRRNFLRNQSLQLTHIFSHKIHLNPQFRILRFGFVKAFTLLYE